MKTDIIDRIVAQNLGVYEAAPSRLQEDVSQEAQVASDYRGRLVYELLQNADDAMQGEAGIDDTVTFAITDNELWVANNGRALTESDVQGLCGLGASSKVDAHGTRRASIGHKGLGFKSVLEITESPRVFSQTYRFDLGSEHARPHVDPLWAERGLDAPRLVPSMRFPARVDQESEFWTGFQAQGANTAFVFPFRDDLDQSRRLALADLLLDLPLTTVLFLKHLERVEVRVEQSGRALQRVWTVRREILDPNDGWRDVAGLTVSGLYRVRVSTDDLDEATFLVAHDDRVEIGPNRLGLSGPAWEGVTTSEVSVAVLDPAEELAAMPLEWRHFHVFLPTEEACPYPMLVNAAFVTDLSRQQVRVTGDTADYNSHLIREAASLFRRVLVEQLERFEAFAVLAVLDRWEETEAESAADTFHEALISELRDVPLLPTETGERISFHDAVVPPTILEDEGSSFRQVLGRDPAWRERWFPTPEYCAGRWASVATDHGSMPLTPAEGLAVLGRLADPVASALRDHESGGFEIDPILEVCVSLWERADSEEREEVEARARLENLFPIQRNDDRTVERVALGSETAFYPPRSARHELPLDGLQFMSHAVCWGALMPKERASMLEDRMRAWNALFDIKEFRFQEVMRAAVMPALLLGSDEETVSLHQRLRNMESLSAICQLAGTYAKPNQPLRYQRLRSDRALFNLSRLPVPCRLPDGTETWLPAYRVYFGSDWVGNRSVERILDSVPEGMLDSDEIDLPILAGRSRFLGMLRDIDGSTDSEDDESGEVSDDNDEVGIDEDTDRALESDEFTRWVAFLTWIGVNQALRPIHFHDVMDRDAGWLTTKGLQQPSGWAFRSLESTWDDYRSQLERSTRLSDDQDVVPYAYEIHDLEAIVPLLRCAEQDVDGGVGTALLEHLVRHWDFYEDFTQAQLALVKKGKWPGQRSKPPRATPEELVDAGDNLWLFRLQRRRLVPTTHGPRSPDQAWMPTAEVERRFGGRGRSAGDWIPLLELDGDLPPRQIAAVAERIGVRDDLSPSTFKVQDADLLCQRLKLVFSKREIDTASLRTVIRPVYRQMFELLSGSTGDRAHRRELGSAPLLVETSEGFSFIDASGVLYARTPGYRERSGIDRQVPIFVLEAEPRANAPLSQLFGVRALEDEVEWNPSPGEHALDDDQMEQFRSGLAEMVPELLARIRAERSEDRDRRVLEDFVTHVLPVDSLELSCSIMGRTLDVGSGREYFVRSESRGSSLQAFILWDGPPWPPAPREAQLLAMALADALEVNLVETFVAFLQSDRDQRLRLLNVAGAVGYLKEVEDDLAAATPQAESDSFDSVEIGKTVATSIGQNDAETAATIGRATIVPVPRVPLHRLDELAFEGDVELIIGSFAEATASADSEHPAGGSSGSGSGRKAAPGTDLVVLDRLGMGITIEYEMRRLRNDGVSSPQALSRSDEPSDGCDLVIDVSTPESISRAESASEVAKTVLSYLEHQGLSLLYPGFDILTIRSGKAQRLIELKSSGVDARVQSMSWNEWKTAGHSDLRDLFWLYLVGNLRSDLPGAPYLRAVHDPFGSLRSEEYSEHSIRKVVQLRVHEFATAEEMKLSVRSNSL